MGTVRLTEERRKQYRVKAEEMFEKANPFPEFTPEETIKVMNSMSNHPIQIAVRGFMTEQKALYNVSEDDGNLPFNIKFAQDTIDRVPCFMSSNDETHTTCKFPTQLTLFGTDRSYYSSNCEDWNFAPDVYFSDPREILMMQAAIRRVIDERNAYKEAHSKFTHGVKDALNNCNTLGQLIKLWPAAENLASEEDMRKLHTKETRAQTAKRVREEIDLDVGALNTTVLTANLIGD
jgi:hypothetical protein